jgi:hypothetical protein
MRAALKARRSGKGCAVAFRANGGCLHEIYDRQALDRGRRPQNEPEPSTLCLVSCVLCLVSCVLCLVSCVLCLVSCPLLEEFSR